VRYWCLASLAGADEAQAAAEGSCYVPLQLANTSAPAALPSEGKTGALQASMGLVGCHVWFGTAFMEKIHFERLSY